MAGISNHFDTITYIVAQLNALSFTGLTGGVVFQDVPDYIDGQIQLPFISVSAFGDKRNATIEPLNLDGVIYKTLIVIVRKPNVNDSASRMLTLEATLGWRQKISQKLNNVQIPGTRNYNLIVGDGRSLEPKVFRERKLYASALVISANFQEPKI